MGFRLGNVSIKEFLDRTGYNMTKEDIAILETHRQDNATIDPNSDKFHIFDVPFHICVAGPFKTELINILMKYEEISKSKETLGISEVVETEKERERRLKKEKEEQEWKEKLENPNSVWNIKWHMLVPVIVEGHEAYYGCFINTYTTGRNNIPDIIDGTASIRMDEEGFHGHFSLYNSEENNDANEYPEWNWVIGSGFYGKSGAYIGTVNNAYFEETQFSIKEAIETYENLKDNGNSKEIHFDKIKNN